MPSTPPQPGEVWLCDLGLAAKRWPVIIVSRYDSNAPRTLVTYVPVTTQNRNSCYEIRVEAGFLAAGSFANVQGIGSVPTQRLERCIGVVSHTVMLRILHAVAFALGMQNLPPLKEGF